MNNIQYFQALIFLGAAMLGVEFAAPQQALASPDEAPASIYSQTNAVQVAQNGQVLSQEAELIRELGQREKKLLSAGLSQAACRKSEIENQQLRENLEIMKKLSAKMQAELEQVKDALIETGKKLKDSQVENEKKLKEHQSQLSEKQLEVIDLKRQLSKTIEDTRSCQQLNQSKDQAIAVLQKLHQELAAVKQQYSQKEKESAQCLSELEMGKQQLINMAALRRDYLAVQNELAMQKMSDSLCKQREQTSKGVSRVRGPRTARTAAPLPPPQNLFQQPNPPPAVVPNPAPVRQASPAPVTDVMTLEVVAPKVNLRSGPGEENSPVMQVAQGTRLVVEERQGDWFRVITPTGTRAYILHDVVKILDEGSKSSSAPAVPPGVPINQPNGSIPRPAKPPVRVGRGNSSNFEPFGESRLKGRDMDLESIAMERLRAMGDKTRPKVDNAQ